MITSSGEFPTDPLTRQEMCLKLANRKVRIHFEISLTHASISPYLVEEDLDRKKSHLNMTTLTPSRSLTEKVFGIILSLCNKMVYLMDSIIVKIEFTFVGAIFEYFWYQLGVQLFFFVPLRLRLPQTLLPFLNEMRYCLLWLRLRSVLEIAGY